LQFFTQRSRNQIPKPTEYQAAANFLDSCDQGAFAVGKPKANNAIFSEALAGHTDADLQCKWILVNQAAIARLTEQRFSFDNLFELAYVLEKCNLRSQETILGSQAVKTALSDVLRNRWATATKYYLTANKNIHRWVFVVLSLFAVVFMTQMSKNASISGDEFTQYTYSKLIANYYLDPIGMAIPIDTNELKGQRMPTLAKALPEMGSDVATIKDPDRVMHVYGSSFDTFTTILGHWLGVDDYMGFRHWWNAIFGFLAIFYTALIVKQLTKGSWLYAWAALLVMLFMPRFFGEAMNNPKDVPFALGYVMSLYYALKLFKGGRNFAWNNVIGLVFGTALGISVRIGGLLSVAIFIMYAGLKYIESLGLKQFLSFKWKGITNLVLWLGSLGLASYILGMLGLGLFTLLLYPNRKQFNNEIFLILFAAIFPVVYIYIQKSQVYGGIRQILFTLPCFVGIAFVGYQWLDLFLSKMNSKLKGATLVIVLVLTALPAKFIFSAFLWYGPCEILLSQLQKCACGLFPFR